MCGIAGIICIDKKEEIKNIIKISSKLSHRGPDDEGFFIVKDESKKGLHYSSDESDKKIKNLSKINQIKNEKFKYALCHRRFSILDTSINGHQPMSSNDNKVILSFNGEIFNYKEIKKELINLGYSFLSSTDSEVVLKSYIEWGVECFKKFNGFWAISILDLNFNKLILSRDRFGQKPLYYFLKNDNIYFSSEISSLRSVCPEINKLNRKSAYLYLYHDRRDSLTSSLYNDLKSVKSATYVTYNLNSGKLDEHIYWEYPKVENNNKTIQELSSELDKLLHNSVKIRLRSDVPLAANLSGGLDSAAIVRYASDILKNKKIKLTTHTFEYSGNKSLSEKDDAALISDSCKTNHEVLYFDSNDVWGRLKDLVRKIEEPVHSPAAYIQLIAWEKLASMGYKVILHGASNDELMMGYSYFPDIIDRGNIRKLKFPYRMQGNSIFYYKNIGRIIKWFLTKKIIFKKNTSKINHPKNPVFKDNFLNENLKSYNTISSILSSDESEFRRLADFQSLRIPFWNNYMDKSMMSIPIEIRFPF